MRENEILTVVKNRFKKIIKLFPRIISDFKIEDIQQFRAEIKKLRSFFHLLDMEVNGEIKFKITSKMNTFYGYTGIIRNLQLHLNNIKSDFDNSTYKNSASYIAKLGKELEYWKKNTKEFMDLNNNFYNDEEEIVSDLPDKLRKTSIKKFIRYTIFEIQKLLTRLDDDETLHSIRKFLEDILYNWSLIPYSKDMLPAGLSEEEEIKAFIEILGIFRDKCIELTLLHTYYSDATEDEEKILLLKIAEVLKIQKQELKQIICSKLELIPVKPIVAGSFSYRNWF